MEQNQFLSFVFLQYNFHATLKNNILAISQVDECKLIVGKYPQESKLRDENTMFSTVLSEAGICAEIYSHTQYIY